MQRLDIRPGRKREEMSSEGTTVSKGDQWLKGWCGMCLQNDCGMLVHVKDGVVVEVEGNKDCPTNRGKLCVRGGLVCIPGYYSPFRIKGPLKRTNPSKGLDEDPGWVEITWEEAFETVAKKLAEVLSDRKSVV